MKITNIEDIHKHFSVGDEVWACAFKHEMDSTGKVYRNLYQEPVLGVFVTHRTGAKDKSKLKNGGNTKIKYFVPLKKDGIEPMYSKLVNLESRCYASTEEECKELFKQILEENINLHNKIIKELKNKISEVC